MQATALKGVARVISIGVGNSTDEVELRDVIATSPEDYIRVENFEQLSLRLDRLIAAVSDVPDNSLTWTHTSTDKVVSKDAYPNDQCYMLALFAPIRA